MFLHLKHFMRICEQLTWYGTSPGLATRPPTILGSNAEFAKFIITRKLALSELIASRVDHFICYKLLTVRSAQ